LPKGSYGWRSHQWYGSTTKSGQGVMAAFLDCLNGLLSL